MLGLGGAMHMEDGIVQSATPTISLFDVPNLIGWWDFGDQATMYTATSLGGINPTNNVDFRSITNKSSHVDRLGSFLQGSGTSISGYNASYQENASGDYARFNAAESTYSPFDYSALKRNSYEEGVASSGVVSSANIDLQNFSFFAVLQAEAVDPGNNNRTLFYLNGQDVDGSITQLNVAHERNSPNDLFVSIYMADEPSVLNRIDKIEVGEEALTSKHLLSFNSGTGTNAAKSYINGVEKSQATIDGDDVLTLDNNYSAVMIGNRVNANAIPAGPTSHFRGNIWEVIFYNQSLTSEQLTFVHNILMEKHGLT